MGDAGSAPLPGDRHVAYQYNSIAPVASFSAGDKLKKLGKMLVFFLGKGGPVDVVSVSDLAIVPTAEESGSNAYAYGDDSNKRAVSPGAQQLLSLFRGLRTYFQPSNGGWWSFEMALLMNCVLHSLAWRVGEETALREAGQSTRTGELTRDDAGLVVDALLPLVLEMVYSKNSSVGTMSNYCLSTLASLSPKSVTPAVVELVLRALDPVASINHTHQVNFFETYNRAWWEDIGLLRYDIFAACYYRIRGRACVRSIQVQTLRVVCDTSFGRRFLAPVPRFDACCVDGVARSSSHEVVEENIVIWVLTFCQAFCPTDSLSFSEAL